MALTDTKAQSNAVNMQRPDQTLEGIERQGEYEIDLIELLYRLLEKMKYIVLTALLGALIAGVWTFRFVTPSYTATAKMYVLNANDSVLNLSDMQIGTYLAADYKEVFTNWHVHEMVIQRLGLPYTYRQMGSMISVSNPTGTRILYIKVTAHDPDEAKAIADEYAKVAQEFIASKMETKEPNIFEEALRPSAPSAPNKTRNVALGFLIGAALAGSLFTLQFITDDRIRNGDDLAKYLHLPTLGMMPLQRHPDDKKERGRKNSGKDEVSA